MFAALKRIPIFQGLDETDCQAVGSRAAIKSFRKNVVILSEGDRSHSLYVVLSGSVRVFLSDDAGKEVVLNIQGPGEFFGELALIDDEPRSASVMTLEPTTLAIISKADFQELIGHQPVIAIRLLRALSRRARLLTTNVKSLALLDVYGRVAKLLLNMAVERDGVLAIPTILSQQEIANMVGASREMVSRILKDLASGGFIKRDRRRIIVAERPPARW
ncbi:MAG: Crp/Fnr family transcriptional regulator [Acidobacteria bacterium]|nr:Crp/Fnr family transcriptional regulator [Acidobacteriota bacterium]